jgi:RNA polymerase sigma-70 factor, ECF subfamily
VGSPGDQRSDADLIEAAKAGDLAAFEGLYERYRDWVFRLALRFTGNREVALDVMQETFMHLLKRLPGFELRAQITTYLYPVTRNIAFTMMRRRMPQALRGEGAAVPTGDDPPVESAGALAPLARALDALPLPQREVLILRYADDLGLAEIAAALGVPLGTVKSRLHNALGALRADPQLKEYFE